MAVVVSSLPRRASRLVPAKTEAGMDPVASLLLEGRVDVEAVPALVEAGLASGAARALERQWGGAAAGASGRPARAALARAGGGPLARHATAMAAGGPPAAPWSRAGRQGRAAY